ncbi:MAG: CoA-acylating methylmalonate-semialdehyde dehydrogenase [Brevinema sp.]
MKLEKGHIVKNYVNGEWYIPKGELLDITNPTTGEVIAQVPLSSKEEVGKAVTLANEAFKIWRTTPPVERSRYLYNLQQLFLKHFDEIVEMVMLELGKSYVDSKGEVTRALENIEVAAGTPTLMQGYNSEDIARGIDEYAIRRPLGVMMAIGPYNFPSMIPFWFAPYAVATGNTFILKSSEKVPLTSEFMVSLVEQAGFPKGVFNLVNGGKETVEALIENPLVKGVSFVGSSNVAHAIYVKAAQEGKRAQCQGGACNFIVIMPDSPLDQCAENIVNSFYACAGQRCLAGQNLIIVGDQQRHEEVKSCMTDIVKKLKVGIPSDKTADFGAVITQEHKNSIIQKIDHAEKDGANIVVDGRNFVLKGYENGFFLGATLIDFPDSMHQHPTVHEEIFGPVMNILCVKNLDEAIAILESNPYGNAANIYTQSGYSARKFAYEVHGGNVGINIGVPAPVPHFPFGGMKRSFFGVLHGQGQDVIEFMTEKQIVIQRFYTEDN